MEAAGKDPVIGKDAPITVSGGNFGAELDDIAGFAVKRWLTFANPMP